MAIKKGTVAIMLVYIQKVLIAQQSYSKSINMFCAICLLRVYIFLRTVLFEEQNILKEVLLVGFNFKMLDKIKGGLLSRLQQYFKFEQLQISLASLYLFISMKTNLSSTLLITLLSVSLVSLYFMNVHNDQQSDLFEEWKLQYHKTFDHQEEMYRKIIFQRNVQIINKHNADQTQTYKMAVNQFTIYTEHEFKEIFLGEFSTAKSNYVAVDDTPSNIEIDWTTKGAVSPVKNQGSCGSCWAFAAVASCQSWNLLEKKTTVSLSEQQLVDCSGSYGNHGCNGGSRGMALKYVKDKGITTQSAYPYKAVTQTCKSQGGSFKINTVTQANGGCSGIQSALQGRPVAVAVDAGGWSHYSSGVFNNCGTAINHAVLLVGVVNGAWKIKNSWGSSWGERGFIRLASGNTCGVCQEGAVYPH